MAPHAYFYGKSVSRNSTISENMLATLWLPEVMEAEMPICFVKMLYFADFFL